MEEIIIIGTKDKTIGMNTGLVHFYLGIIVDSLGENNTIKISTSIRNKDNIEKILGMLRKIGVKESEREMKIKTVQNKDETLTKVKCIEVVIEKPGFMRGIL